MAAPACLSQKDGLHQSISLTAQSLPEYVEWLFAQFDQLFSNAAESASFSIAGQAFECRSFDSVFLQQVRDHVSGYPTSQTSPDCRILVVAESGGNLAVPRWTDRAYDLLALENLMLSSHYRVHHFMEKGFWQFFDVNNGRGIQLVRAVDGLPDWEPGAPLRNFIFWHFAALGKCLIHAGTLGSESGGILLGGSGGSGKSSTVIGGIMNGLGSVGDDYVLVDSGDDATAYPVFTLMKQDEAGYRRLGLDRVLGHERSLNWQGKYEFPASDVAVRRQPVSMPLLAVCLPHIGHEASTSFHRIDAKQAFMTLAPSGVWQLPGDRQTMFKFCGRLVRRLPCYRIALSSDPEEIAAACRTFILELMS